MLTKDEGTEKSQREAAGRGFKTGCGHKKVADAYKADAETA